MLRSAISEAGRSNIHRARMGAVITKGRRILSVGHNEMRGYRKCPSKRRWVNSLHAEQAAILKLLNKGKIYELSGATIHVTRIKRDGNVGMARPCETCEELIRAVGIKRVIYTNDLGKVEEYRV